MWHGHAGIFILITLRVKPSNAGTFLVARGVIDRYPVCIGFTPSSALSLMRSVKLSMGRQAVSGNS